VKAELLHRYQTLLHQVQEQAHTLEDLIEGRTTVDVEGNGGRDVFRAKQLGLFTANVKGVDIIATCEAEAAPLIHYLEQGGVYGSLEFSRLLGYSEEQLAQYQELLLLQDKLGIPPWGYRKASILTRLAKLAEKRWGGFTFKIDRPKGFVKEWDQPDGSVKRYTYPVDYGYFVGHKGEDNEGLDAFVGSDSEGIIESFLKMKPDENGKLVPDETKFLVGLTPKEREQVMALYEPESVTKLKEYKDVYALLSALEGYRSAKRVASQYLASENEPTNEELWKEAIAEAKKRFDKYPSAYANGWASKWYKEHGGGWRKKEARGKAKKDVGHGGLDEWFSGHSGGKGEATWGDWVAISPVTKELESGKKVKPGDILGPCGISDDPDWKDVTKGGKDPLKCMPRQKAHDMPKAERADLAKDKMKAERQEGNSKKPVMTPTFKKDSAQRVASRYLMAAEGKYDHINFKPPESVANAAKKGLEHRQKASPSNKGGLTVSEAAKQGIGSGVQRAVNLKNRDKVSPETIGKMVAFFSRHEKNKGIAPEHKSEPWNDKGHVAWLLWGGDSGRTWAEKVKGQMEAADKKKSASRVAQRYLEAGVTDWLKWIVQPFAVLAKHHREFVYGPVDDAFDAVIKELAPKLVRELTEKEVESDVDDFLRGALAGRDGKPLSSSESADFRAGYVWGKVNKDDKDLQRGDLPAYMKRQVIQSSVAEFRKRITETVLKDALKKAWHAINPMTTFNAIKSAVKKHGWKLGVGFALFELFEHFVLPAVLSTLFDDPRLLSLATLPIGEVVYAVMFRILGRTPAEVNKADEAGHLDWYEQEFGPIRLAALPS